jgi:O-methyltransferase
MTFLRALAERFPRLSDRVRISLVRQYRLHPYVRFMLQSAVRPYASLDLRYFRYLYCLERTKSLPGDVAECGLGSGLGMVYIAGYLQANKDNRNYHGFDTFEGFPYIAPEDTAGLSEERKAKYAVVGRYAWYDVSHFGRMLKHLRLDKRVRLWKGRFEETLPTLEPDQKFSFIFLDCDLYDSYKVSLEHMYPRVVDGGLILFDEYERPEWPGAKKAIDEFFADRKEKPCKLPFGESWYVQKGMAF